jgi:hypothetical protein
MKHILLLLLLVLAAPALPAQGVFRSVMPDGKIVYGSKPEPGAKESQQVNLPPPNISAPAPRGAAPSAAKEQTLNTADDEVRQAQNQLDAAKSALEGGREPLEGERTGTAKSGASRLNEDYDKRIKSLENAVAAAQKRLDAALGRRNSAR